MAQKIYVGQTALIMKLDTKIDLSTAATALMRYRKPSGASGSWVCATDANNLISYTIVNASDLDEPGTWTRWADITFVGGTWAPGDPVTFVVHSVGS